MPPRRVSKHVANRIQGTTQNNCWTTTMSPRTPDFQWSMPMRHGSRTTTGQIRWTFAQHIRLDPIKAKQQHRHTSFLALYFWTLGRSKQSPCNSFHWHERMCYVGWKSYYLSAKQTLARAHWQKDSNSGSNYVKPTNSSHPGRPWQGCIAQHFVRQSHAGINN